MNLQAPYFQHNPWSDAVPGSEGADGWYSDHFSGVRVIFFAGTWAERQPKAPLWGFGDVLRNLFAWPANTPAGLVHAGYKRWADDAIRALSMAGVIDTDKPLVLVGHSAGAAQAAIAAVRLYGLGYTVKSVKLYSGVPCCSSRFLRVFSTLWPDATNQVLGNDAVQLLPLLMPWWRVPGKRVHLRRTYSGPIDWVRGFVESHLPVNMDKFITFDI